MVDASIHVTSCRFHQWKFLLLTEGPKEISVHHTKFFSNLDSRKSPNCKSRGTFQWKSWSLPIMFNSVQSLSHVQLWPHESQHARPPCPAPTPGVYSNPCPSSRWCHPAISSCHPLLLLPPIPPSIRVFSNESTLCIRWPKYWSFIM